MSAKVQQLRGGPAYLFTFVRTKPGTAQSIALVKLGGTNYTIDTVTKANDTGGRHGGSRHRPLVRPLGRSMDFS